MRRGISLYFSLFGYSAYQALGNGHKGNGGKPFGKSNGVGAYDSVQGPFIKGLFDSGTGAIW